MLEKIVLTYQNETILNCGSNGMQVMQVETSATMCFCRVHMYSPFAGAANAWYARVIVTGKQL